MTTLQRAIPSEQTAPARRRRVPSTAAGWLLSISFPLFLILVWEVVTQGFGVPAYVLPAPGSVATALGAHISQLAHFGLSTVVETVAGFAIAAVAGVIIAAGIAYSKVLSRMVYPSLVATQSIPKIAIGPLFVGWLGLGLVPKIAMAAITAVFPIVINTAAGLKEIDPNLIQLSRSAGAPATTIFYRVRLPAASGYIFSGLKMGMTFSLIGAIVGEFIGGNIGIGYYIESVTGALQMNDAFAGVVVLGVIGVVLYGVVEIAERIACPWKRLSGSTVGQGGN